MDCICSENTYWQGNLIESALIGESKSGARTARILTGLKLTITKDGFKLTNTNNATLRQGTETNVFAVFDSMAFPCDNLRLSTQEFSGTFEDYELAHGHGRVERSKVVKFTAFTETTKSATSIGITRLAGGGKTKAIFAFYYDYAMSRREKAKVIADFVYTLLRPKERASITAVGVTVDKINGLYAGIIRTYGDAYKPKHEEARLLYGDAMESGQSIAEVFETAMEYKTQGLFEDEAEATQAKEGGGQE